MHEPRLALDGGPDGLDLYRRIIRASGSVLAPGGKLLMETGINETAELSGLLSENGFASENVLHFLHLDLAFSTNCFTPDKLSTIFFTSPLNGHSIEDKSPL